MSMQCKICSTHRPIDRHLFELSEYCRFLNNSLEYFSKGNSRVVKTETIASWLRLAADLDNVDINSWKFDDGLGSLYCEPIAYENNSNSKHYSKYTTLLTRFLYISYALEETYRFVVAKYIDIKSELKKFSEPSQQAAIFLENLKNFEKPKDFEHLCDNLKLSFYQYDKDYKSKLRGVRHDDGDCQGLHLVRNIRNYISHGVLPIAENPEYLYTESGDPKILKLLMAASRVALIYIQVFLYNSVSGFTSDIVNQIENDEYEFDRNYFSKNCTRRLLLDIHLQSNFTFQDPVGNLVNNFYID